MSTTAEQIDRMMRAGGFDHQKRLAEALGVSSSVLSTAKSRKILPQSVLFAARDKLGLEPRWIKTGEPPMYTVWDPRRQEEESAFVRRAARERRMDDARRVLALENGYAEHAVLARMVTIDTAKLLECTATALNRLYETAGHLTLEGAATGLAEDVAAVLQGDVTPERRLSLYTHAVALVGA